MKTFRENGFAVVNDFYSSAEVLAMLEIIEQASSDRAVFRRSANLFAIRQVLKEIPSLAKVIFNYKLRQFIFKSFGADYFVSKSIYFDKPADSNWFVAYHQDLTISVKEKIDTPGFSMFTKKQDQYAVQPPVQLLEQNFTIRIHLDDTDERNGALRVLPASHLQGIQRPETADALHKEQLCSVEAGGIMFMHPLLMHASSRSTGTAQRRVLHIEFSNQELPDGLEWSEKMDFQMAN